jgi:hypothetical protein
MKKSRVVPGAKLSTTPCRSIGGNMYMESGENGRIKLF